MCYPTFKMDNAKCRTLYTHGHEQWLKVIYLIIFIGTQNSPYDGILYLSRNMLHIKDA
jgi:hypothetical protein